MTAEEKARYFELLRFKSVGVDKTKQRDCVECATWLKRALEDAGFSASLRLPDGVSGPPCLYAERIVDPDAVTVLFYGHYDVQPPDPLGEWKSDPFEPVERDGRVYCRGAQDDKGQLFAFFCGMKRFLAASPDAEINIKVLLEGQEESGGDIIWRVAEGMAKKLRADVLLVSDTNAVADLRPTIIAGLRGVCHFTVSLKGAKCDLHSGIYGGIAPNAADAMARLLSSLHNDDGSIAVDGFSNGIVPPSAREIELAEASSSGEAAIEADIGCRPCGGERGRSVVERNSFMPTIEVNGIHSGYGGPGSKTVIPCEALAKISMRLVPGQSPRGAFEAVCRHLESRVPEGLTLKIYEATGFSEGFRLPLGTPLFRLATEVLESMDSRGPAFLWEGASIPCVSMLSRVSGASPLLVGWGQPEDAIHSPNESFSIRQFDLASMWGERILGALAPEKKGINR